MSRSFFKITRWWWWEAGGGRDEPRWLVQQRLSRPSCSQASWWWRLPTTCGNEPCYTGSSVFVLPKCCWETILSRVSFPEYSKAHTAFSVWLWYLQKPEGISWFRSTWVRQLGNIREEPGRWAGNRKETKSKRADVWLGSGLSTLVGERSVAISSPRSPEVHPVDWSHDFLVISWSRFSMLSTRRTPGSITASLPMMQAQPCARSRRWKSVSPFLKIFHLKTGT